jgi:hypothetical protein
MSDYVLLEDGSGLLLQDGVSHLVLELASAAIDKTLAAAPGISIAVHGQTLVGFLLQEDGTSYLLLQDGSGRLMVEEASAYDLTRLGAAPSISFATRAALLPTLSGTAAISIATTPKLSDAFKGTQVGVVASRLGAFRLAYIPATLAKVRKTRVHYLVNGLPSKVRYNSVTIHDVINDAPNTCSLTIDAATPPMVTQSLRITINSDAPQVLFEGTLQTVDVSYQLLPSQLVYPCTAIDDTPGATRRLPYGTWTNTPADAVAQAIVATFAPGYSGAGIVANLPNVTVFFDGSEGMNGCMQQLAKLIGGYFYWEDRTLHLFQTETGNTPDPIDTAHPFLNDPPILLAVDDTQIRTRNYGRGYADQIAAALPAYATIIPVANAVYFNPNGGQAVTGTSRITYTGVNSGGRGLVNGVGVQPTSLLTLAPSVGTGLGLGTYQYAMVFVTAAGRSLPSPIASVQTIGPGTLPAPTLAISLGPQADNYGDYSGTAPDYNATSTIGMHIGDTVFYAYSFGLAADPLDLTHETAFSPYSNTQVIRAVSHYSVPGGWIVPCTQQGNFTIYQSAIDGGAIWVHYWRFLNGAAPILATYQGIQNAGWMQDFQPPLGQTSWTVNPVTAAHQQVTVSGIALGPAAVTKREIYRTAVNGSQLKLVTTINDNTSTGPFVDAVPDASLGANVPTSDTSGLTQQPGQTAAGATSILMVGVPGDLATEGWLLVGNMPPIHYTGISGNTLTGIPAGGITPIPPGAIANSIPYGTVITSAPSLLGVTGLAQPVISGQAINLWIQVDDVAAQQAVTALDGSDGIIEHLIVDERRAEASLRQLCQADLNLYSHPIKTVTYATRDVKTKSGQPIGISLTSPPINALLTIQDVTITELDLAPGLAPRFSVSASSVRFSLDDMLRQLASNSPT